MKPLIMVQVLKVPCFVISTTRTTRTTSTMTSSSTRSSSNYYYHYHHQNTNTGSNVILNMETKNNCYHDGSHINFTCRSRCTANSNRKINDRSNSNALCAFCHGGRMKMTKLDIDDDFFDDDHDKDAAAATGGGIYTRKGNIQNLNDNTSFNYDKDQYKYEYEDLSENTLKQLQDAKPNELLVMKELLGINGITYVLLALIAFFLTMNTILGPGWLGQLMGMEGTGTFTDISTSLPDEVDLSRPENLL